MKIPFLSVLDLDIRTYLNMLSYVIWKNKEIDKKYNKDKKQY